ncbi:MAG: Minf_1886 family protein [Candidatus Krumholzibacteriota bacterium]
MHETMDLMLSIRNLAERRGVFRPEAYFFVLEALENAMASMDERGHITGEDLLEWIRDLGQERYGIMAGDVFNVWGVHATIDFGRIVFHLVEAGLLRKRDEDSLSDFIDKFNFQDAFALKVSEGRG